jgi:DNA-binding CsgD family transcriptional regulator
MALALSHLGEIALAQEEYRHAQELYQESLAIYQKLGDRGGLVRVLHGLGVTTGKLGNDSLARDYFRRALQAASEAQFVPLILSVLVGIGTYLLEKGRLECGLKPLVFAQRHPATDQMLKNRVARLLASHPEVIYPQTSGLELEALIATLLADLEVPAPAAGRQAAPVDQPLVDPLSERELEVLQLIAAGLTNRQIAGELTIVIGTVKAHTSNIYGKLGVSNRTQAVARARELKIL